MKRFFIKRTSRTQKRALEALTTLETICHKAEITREQWSAIVFETGCQWAESYIDQPRLCLDFLTNSDRGYWAWWLSEFVEDDKALLEQNRRIENGKYIQLKKQMIHAAKS